MIIDSGFYLVGKENIYYEKIKIENIPCNTIVLHGAGSSDSTRSLSFRKALYARGISTLAIDFSGHGNSTKIELSSIKKRIYEAREMISKYLDNINEIQIIAFSMSGEVAIRLTQFFSVRNLVLFAPGIYNKDAIDIEFGENFSSMIRAHESWKGNSVQEILYNYQGLLFLLVPEFDDTIPEGVNQIIMSSAPCSHKERILIKGAPHMIGKWMNEYPEQIEEFIDQLQLL